MLLPIQDEASKRPGCHSGPRNNIQPPVVRLLDPVGVYLLPLSIATWNGPGCSKSELTHPSGSLVSPGQGLATDVLMTPVVAS